jgi:hypothetical protein
VIARAPETDSGLDSPNITAFNNSFTDPRYDTDRFFTPKLVSGRSSAGGGPSAVPREGRIEAASRLNRWELSVVDSVCLGRDAFQLVRHPALTLCLIA